MPKVVDKVNRLLMNGYIGHNRDFAPQTLRDSDKKLLLAYWEQQGLVLSPEQKQTFLDKCTVAESITRARRHLKVKYPASKKIDEARFNNFKRFRGEGIEHEEA